MQLYVHAKSKKAVNEFLTAGIAVFGENYSMFDGAGTYDLTEVPNGTMVKIFSKYVGGSPYAKAYGLMQNGKLK